jgi:hypothetical protein
MDLLLKKYPGKFAIFAKDYNLFYNNSVCTTLSFYDWKTVKFTTGEGQYLVCSETEGKWRLEQEGVTIARCSRVAHGPKLEFEISFDNRVWHFKPKRRKLLLTHDVWEDEQIIGRVSPRIKFWWSEISATFNPHASLKIASFAIWIIGIHWVAVAGKLNAARAEKGI